MPLRPCASTRFILYCHRFLRRRFFFSRFHFRMDGSVCARPLIAQSHNSVQRKQSKHMKMDRRNENCAPVNFNSISFHIRETSLHFLALVSLGVAHKTLVATVASINVPILRIVTITIRGEHTTHGANKRNKEKEIQTEQAHLKSQGFRSSATQFSAVFFFIAVLVVFVVAVVPVHLR